MYAKVATVMMFSLLTLSCTHKQQGIVVGSLVGAGTGYYLSDDKKSDEKIASIVGGALVGGFIGGVIGSYMDRTDRLKVQAALKSLPTKKKRKWKNPRTGNTFTIQPISGIKRDAKGRYRQAYIWGQKKGQKKPDFTKQKIYID